jgi:hypothetical protein
MTKQILTKSLLAAVALTLTFATATTFAQTASTGLSHHVQPMGDPGAPTPDPTGDGN